MNHLWMFEYTEAKQEEMGVMIQGHWWKFVRLGRESE